MVTRYGKDDLRRIAELLNRENGATLVERVEFYSPGDRLGTRVEVGFRGAPSSMFLGCADAARALHTCRYALMSLAEGSADCSDARSSNGDGSTSSPRSNSKRTISAERR